MKVFSICTNLKRNNPQLEYFVFETLFCHTCDVKTTLLQVFFMCTIFCHFYTFPTCPYFALKCFMSLAECTNAYQLMFSMVYIFEPSHNHHCISLLSFRINYHWIHNYQLGWYTIPIHNRAHCHALTYNGPYRQNYEQSPETDAKLLLSCHIFS